MPKKVSEQIITENPLPTFYEAMRSGWGLKLEEAYNYHFNRYSMKAHMHRRIELLLVCEGNCRIRLFPNAEERIGGEEQEHLLLLGPQEMIFLDGGLRHRLAVNEDGEGARLMQLSFVMTPPGEEADLPDFASLETDSPAVSTWLQEEAAFLRLYDEGSITGILEGILRQRSLSQPPAVQSQILTGQLRHLFWELGRLYVATRDKTVNPYVSRSLDYMAAHFDRPISIAEIAEFVGIHPAYLQRIFRQTRGVTILHHITDLRMHKAGLLVRDTDIPVTEIAQEVGYNNRQTFNAVFAEYFHITPLAYRRNSRANMLN